MPTGNHPAAMPPVLLAIDRSPASERATALAFDEASRRGVNLVTLHAWSDVGVFPILGMDWRGYESQGHGILGERLVGRREQSPDMCCATLPRLRSARALAHSRICGRPAGGRGQPRPKRLREHASGLCELCG